MFELITPISYWVLTILWLVIFGLYLVKLRQSKIVGGAVAVLLVILSIDAFRTVFESVYFGLYFNSMFGLLPKGISEVLAQPTLIIIPKVINVVAGLLVLFLLIRRWVPRELREREEWIQGLQEARRVAEEKKKEAVKANKAKTEFLASMSHELRTPLNAVLGFAQMLEADSKNPISQAQKQHVKNIIEGGDHLLELINEVLDLARIEADHVTLVIEEVRANEVVADCVNLANSLGEPRKINIVDQMDNGPCFLLRTDRVRFKQTLLNLLSNAVKYNKDGGTVTVEGRKTENGFLHLSVTDTGVGIARKDHEAVFHLFHRLGVDPMVTKEGAGIGLTVTKQLVERMAGRVGFESEEGVGSTFWIDLPLTSNDDVLIWTDTLRVGIDAIDKDHQVLFSLLNKVTHGNVDEKDMDKLIEDLIDYTNYHFRREEAIMEACGYPEIEKHRNKHQRLTGQVSDLAKEWREQRRSEFLNHFRKFLQGWLFRHVLKEDAKIALHVKGKEQKILRALDIFEQVNRDTHPSD